MTMRIQPLFPNEIDPNPEHVEDRLLADFDAFLAGRGVLPALRRRGRVLLLEALEQIGDPESGWERLSLAACVARTVGEAPATFTAQLYDRLAHELVVWLARSGRLASRGRRRLQQQLAA